MTTRTTRTVLRDARFLGLADELGRIAAGLHLRGWTPATSSNFSFRIDPDHCAVTVSGRDKSRLGTDGRALVLEGWEMLKAFDGIDTHDHRMEVPVLDNRQDIEALAAEADARLDPLADRPVRAYLIAGHGVYVWGPDLATTARHLEALDYLLGLELELARARA